jgi:uncharacterized membrane protein
MDNITGLTLASIVMIIIGILLRFMTPGMNRFYGYKTPTSMANKENWDFSQKYSGNLLAIFGTSLLLIAIILDYIPIVISNNGEKGLFATLLLGSIITIFVLTEHALKKRKKNK